MDFRLWPCNRPGRFGLSFCQLQIGHLFEVITPFSEQVDVTHGVGSPSFFPGQPEQIVNSIRIVFPPGTGHYIHFYYNLFKDLVVRNRDMPGLYFIPSGGGEKIAFQSKEFTFGCSARSDYKLLVFSV